MAFPNPTPATLDMHRELQKVHADLLRHKATCLFAGVILRGDNVIVTDGSVKTACTDGKNKFYGEEFFRKLSVQERRGLVMHENLHDALMHLLRDGDLRKENFQLWNVAADYALNGLIVEWSQQHPDFIKLPEGGLYSATFANMTVRQVYNHLKNLMPPPPPTRHIATLVPGALNSVLPPSSMTQSVGQAMSHWMLDSKCPSVRTMTASGAMLFALR